MRFSGDEQTEERVAAEWIPCSGGFIETDVVRWTDGVWQKPRHRRGRAVNVGNRVVIAEVLRDQDGWLDLLVRGCSVGREAPGREVAVLATNQEIRRKRHTIEKGNPERLRWSDEAARAALVGTLARG